MFYSICTAKPSSEDIIVCDGVAEGMTSESSVDGSVVPGGVERSPFTFNCSFDDGIVCAGVANGRASKRSVDGVRVRGGVENGTVDSWTPS